MGKRILLILVLISILAAIVPRPIFAAIESVKCTPTEPGSILDSGINTALGCIPTGDLNLFAGWMVSNLIFVSTGIAFLLMAFGAITVITSSGNPEKIKAGSETITSALSGLLFIILAVFLLKLIGVDILHIPDF